MSEMTDEERRLLEEAMSGEPAGREIFMPVPDPRAASLMLIHALRENAQLMRDVRTEMGSVRTEMGGVREQVIRWEIHVKTIEGLTGEVAGLKTEIANLKEEQQRRAGMQWLIEWVAKYIPWLAAAAAAVWAIRVNPK